MPLLHRRLMWWHLGLALVFALVLLTMLFGALPDLSSTRSGGGMD